MVTGVLCHRLLHQPSATAALVGKKAWLPAQSTANVANNFAWGLWGRGSWLTS